LSQELYEQPRQDFSQGDILEVAPHVFLDPPLLALQPGENGAYKAEAEPFSAFDNNAGQNVIAKCKQTKAIILTHDCEIDKPQATHSHLCPVVPLSKLKPETQDRVKRNRIYSMFFLPRYGEVLPDSFVDFTRISTVGMDFIKGGKRIVSLSDQGRYGLYAQFIRWLTRWELRELSCPNCNVAFNPTASLPVRSQ
jgi:hypothetical protein